MRCRSGPAAGRRAGAGQRRRGDGAVGGLRARARADPGAGRAGRREVGLERFRVGTMIELPRACLQADRIAERADFFSFGTNDLTQTALGFSRDDIEARLLARYIDIKVLDRSPFETLDTPGVGELIRMGAWLGRKTRPQLTLGVCGEHGGDPDSIEFLQLVRHRLRLLLALPGADRARGRGPVGDPGPSGLSSAATVGVARAPLVRERVAGSRARAARSRRRGGSGRCCSRRARPGCGGPPAAPRRGCGRPGARSGRRRARSAARAGPRSRSSP